jgi:hypothetical protein
VVVGEQGSAELGGERDVDGVGKGEVPAESPGLTDQRPDLGDLQRPRGQLVDGRGDLLGTEDPLEVPAAKYGPAFDVENLGNPRDRITGEQATDRSAALGVSDQFDASGSVDDNQ